MLFSKQVHGEVIAPMTAGSEVRKRPAQAAEKKISLISDEKLLAIYASMQQCRLLAEHVRKMPRKDRPAGARLHSGLEAMLATLTADLNEHDALSVAADDEAAGFLKGLPLAEILRHAETPGRIRPGALKREGLRGHNILPAVQSTPAQLQVACGMALAWKAKWPGNVVAAFCNGGSALSAVWKEVLTFASRHQLPLLLMVHKHGNDPGQFESVARSSLMHGVPLLTVDGNDAVAIYRVVFESLGRARQGRGPTLISCRTDLTSHDQPEDAIRRMELYLERKGILDAGLPRRIGLAFHKKLASASKQTAAERLRLKGRHRQQA